MEKPCLFYYEVEICTAHRITNPSINHKKRKTPKADEVLLLPISNINSIITFEHCFLYNYNRNSDDKINNMTSNANDIPSVKGVAKSKNNATTAFRIAGSLHHIKNITIIPITKNTHMSISSIFLNPYM